MQPISLIQQPIDAIQLVSDNLIQSINDYVNAHKIHKNVDVKVSTLPTISSTTKSLIEGLNTKIQLPKPLFTLHERIKTLEETANKLIVADMNLAKATAHKLRDKVVGLLATAGAIAVTALGIFGGIALGGIVGITLGIAGGAAYLAFGGLFSHYFNLPVQDNCFPFNGKNYTEKTLLLFAGALIPLIQSFRKIPLLTLAKNELEAVVKEQKEIVMKDFSELFEFYRKMQSELKQLETLANTFIKRIEAFIRQIPVKLTEIGNDLERTLLLDNIKVHQQAVKELSTVEKYFQEFTKI